jgi:hypothetical protein
LNTHRVFGANPVCLDVDDLQQALFFSFINKNIVLP